MTGSEPEFSLRLPGRPEREPTPQERPYLDYDGLTVGYDLGVTVCEADSFQEADDISRDHSRGALDDSQPRGPRLHAYVAALLTRWPEVPQSDVIDSPYLGAPSDQPTGPLIQLDFNPNAPDQMQADAVALAHEHGLFVAMPSDSRWRKRPTTDEAERQVDQMALARALDNYPLEYELLGRPWYEREPIAAERLQIGLVESAESRAETFRALLRTGGVDDTLTWRSFQDILGFIALNAHPHFNPPPRDIDEAIGEPEIGLRPPWSAIAIDWGVFLGEAYRQRYPQLRWTLGSNQGVRRSWYLPELTNLPEGGEIEGERFRVVSMTLFYTQRAASEGRSLADMPPAWWPEEDDMLADHRYVRRRRSQ